MFKLLCLGGLVLAPTLCAASARGRPAIVLPFSHLCEDGNLDWIGESIAGSITEALLGEGELMVGREQRLRACERLGVDPTARIALATALKIGLTVDASRVVFGRYEVAPAGGAEGNGARTLSIRAEIYDLSARQLTAQFDVSGPLESLPTLQLKIALEVLRALHPGRTLSEEEFSARWPAVRLDALESYIRGLTAPDPATRHRLFTQAVRLDPNFSQPAFQLGKMHWERGDHYRVAEDWLTKVRPSQPHYLEATFLAGLCRYQFADFSRAHEAFAIVAQSLPLNEVWNNLGAAQSRLGMAEALGSFRQALEGDPADPVYRFNLGYLLWKRGQFEEAAEHLRVAAQLLPEDEEATSFLSRCEQRQGPRPRETRVEGRERLKLNFEEIAYRQLKAVLEPRAE